MSDPGYLVEVASGAALVGFLGSPHCFSMCGGIAGALAQASMRGGRSCFASFGVQLCYSLGRVASYALAGALFGAVGFLLSNTLGMAGRVSLRVFAGFLLIGIGFSIGDWWAGLHRLESLGAKLWGHLAPWMARLQPIDSVGKALLLGLLWGWLPCGLVYSVLATAGSSGSAGAGALTMASFGLGTLPAVLATGSFAQLAGSVVRKRGVRRAAGLLLIGFGLWTIFGAAPMLQALLHGAHSCHSGMGG